LPLAKSGRSAGRRPAASVRRTSAAKITTISPAATRYRPLADGFRITKTFSEGGSLAFKRWKLAELTTERIMDGVRRNFIPNADWQYLF
jgi:hypothetical protein